MVTINGAWSDDANGWVSEVLELTGDIWLNVELSQKGRVVIKKAEDICGPWPKALITKWSGPVFKLRIVCGGDRLNMSDGSYRSFGRFIQIVTTDIPKSIYYVNI